MSNYEVIHRALGRIEGKVDGIVERLASGTVRMDKLDVRVSANERRTWRLLGATGVLAVIGVAFARFVPWVNLLP